MQSEIVIEGLTSWSRVSLFISNCALYFCVVFGVISLLWFDLTEDYNSISLVLVYAFLLASMV